MPDRVVHSRELRGAVPGWSRRPGRQTPQAAEPREAAELTETAEPTGRRPSRMQAAEINGGGRADGDGAERTSELVPG